MTHPFTRRCRRWLAQKNAAKRARCLAWDGKQPPIMGKLRKGIKAQA
jgi:hypothetical protein